MADIMAVVDTAVVVPVNIFPLTDDGDFKTIETAVAYNAAGMDLRWNFYRPAGNDTTSTAVTPTSGGVYDWTHLGNGMYTMEIPASGGGSINNATLGFGWFTGVATGVLPWRGPIIQFSPENIVDSLVDGTDLLEVDAQQLDGGNTPASIAAAVWNPLASSYNSANSMGELLNDAGAAGSPPSAASIADAVWDEATSGHTTAGTTGKALTDASAAGSPPSAATIADAVWDEATSGHVTAGTFGKLAADVLEDTGTTLDDFLDTEIAAIKAKTDNLPSDPADASDIAAAFSALTTKVDTIDDFLDTEIAAIKAKTDNLPSDPADESSIQASIAALGTPPSSTTIADAVLARAVSNVEGTADRHSLGALVMISTNSSISGTAITAKKPSDDSTFATYVVTTSSSADPITGVS